MKKEVHTRSLIEDIPNLVIDQNAETIAELVEATGRSYTWIKAFANDQVTAGRWERVHKRVGNRTTPAYRRVQ